MKVKPVLLAALLGCALVLGTTATSLLAKDTAAKEPAGKADKKAEKPVNAKCAVSEEDVDPAVTLAHKGKTIAFCCKNCAGDFKKEPAKYLKALEEQEKVSATREGEGETEEAEEAEGTEEKEPAGETEEGEKKEEAELNAKCPVSGDDADPATVYKYQGQEVAFCCEDCMKDFKKAPEKFVKNLEKKDKKDKDAGDKKSGEHEEAEEEKEGA